MSEKKKIVRSVLSSNSNPPPIVGQVEFDDPNCRATESEPYSSNDYALVAGAELYRLKAENASLIISLEKAEAINEVLRKGLERFADKSLWKVAMLAAGHWTIAKVKFNSGVNGYDIAQSALAEAEKIEKGE